MNKNDQNDNDVSSQNDIRPAIVEHEVLGAAEQEDGHSSDGSADQYLSSVIEAAVFSSTEPLPLKSLLALFGEGITEDVVESAIESLRIFYQGRGVELVESAGGWRFQTNHRVQFHLDRLRQIRPPKYSRAIMETLAVVAYKQPVTRGEIEEIRGVAVSPQIIRTLEDRGWIVVKCRRESAGRPALYVTTVRFLDDFGLKRLSDLPSLQTFGPALESMNDLSSKEKSGPFVENTESE